MKKREKEEEINVGKHFIGQEYSVKKILKTLDAKNMPLCINEVMALAIANRATDIHLKASGMHFRIDGDMYFVVLLQTYLFIELIRGFYALTKGQHLSPQEVNRGAFTHTSFSLSAPGNTSLDNLEQFSTACRETVLPAVTDELALCIRLRDSYQLPPMDKLGLLPDDLEKLQKLILSRYRGMGVFLFTGPPNSGKSTLLLSILKALYDKAKGRVAVATLEDPVEIIVPEFVQIAINPKAGMTYGDAVKQILTFDQDILLVGEMRDSDAARVVFDAAATGHLTFSTLHTKETLLSFARLKDLGILPSDMSGHLLGIISQRLLQRLCPKCKEAYDATDDIERLDKMGYPGFENGKIFRRREGGCDHCNKLGVIGLVPILEILDTSDKNFCFALSEGKTSMPYLMSLANKQQMRTLFDSAVRRIRMGHVSFEEVVSKLDK